MKRALSLISLFAFALALFAWPTTTVAQPSADEPVLTPVSAASARSLSAVTRTLNTTRFRAVRFAPDFILTAVNDWGLVSGAYAFSPLGEDSFVLEGRLFGVWDSPVPTPLENIGANTVPLALNNRGTAVGLRSPDGMTGIATVWEFGDQYDFPLPESLPQFLNDQRITVGATENGSLFRLQIPHPEDLISPSVEFLRGNYAATGLTDDSRVALIRFPNSMEGEVQSAIWRANGEVVETGPGIPSGINGVGSYMVGTMTAGRNYRAAVWRSVFDPRVGEFRVVTTPLPGAPPFSTASGVNDAGLVVGAYPMGRSRRDARSVAFIATVEGGITPLDALTILEPGEQVVWANQITDTGLVAVIIQKGRGRGSQFYPAILIPLATR